jgi:predicted PhzF superfamily epimerase YddE/YHI9
MMELPLYQIDAFTDRAFAGNPAAVMPLDAWLPDGQLQQIAAENNLAETAFFVPNGDDYHIRWFTPTHEVDLCGHATLASAYVITHFQQPQRRQLRFASRSGELRVERDGKRFILDFPLLPVTPAPDRLDVVAGCFDRRPAAIYKNDGYIAYVAVFERADDIVAVKPDFMALHQLDKDVIVTAPGDASVGVGIDFVSRFFAPNHGIPEDPVTGSAHCLLVHYWADRLGKTTLRARQISARGGDLWLELKGDRVLIAGEGVCVLKGTMTI